MTLSSSTLGLAFHVHYKLSIGTFRNLFLLDVPVEFGLSMDSMDGTALDVASLFHLLQASGWPQANPGGDWS